MSPSPLFLLFAHHLRPSLPDRPHPEPNLSLHLSFAFLVIIFGSGQLLMRQYSLKREATSQYIDFWQILGFCTKFAFFSSSSLSLFFSGQICSSSSSLFLCPFSPFLQNCLHLSKQYDGHRQPSKPTWGPLRASRRCPRSAWWTWRSITRATRWWSWPAHLVMIILTKSVTSHLSWWQGGESGAWEGRPPPPSSLFAIISVDITATVVIIVTIINTIAISIQSTLPLSTTSPPQSKSSSSC